MHEHNLSLISRCDKIARSTRSVFLASYFPADTQVTLKNNTLKAVFKVTCVSTGKNDARKTERIERAMREQTKLFSSLVQEIVNCEASPEFRILRLEQKSMILKRNAYTI